MRPTPVVRIIVPTIQMPTCVIAVRLRIDRWMQMIEDPKEEERNPSQQVQMCVRGHGRVIFRDGHGDAPDHSCHHHQDGSRDSELMPSFSASRHEKGRACPPYNEYTCLCNQIIASCQYESTISCNESKARLHPQAASGKPGGYPPPHRRSDSGPAARAGSGAHVGQRRRRTRRRAADIRSMPISRPNAILRWPVPASHWSATHCRT